MGVIRYMGETDFAKGEWCGVELDEPLGKNDGAVAGTRYKSVRLFVSPGLVYLFSLCHYLIGFSDSKILFKYPTINQNSGSLTCKPEELHLISHLYGHRSRDPLDQITLTPF